MSRFWPIVKLSAILRPVSRAEFINPVKEYRLLGVRLDGRGPFLREIIKGSEIGATKLNRVETGDFIYSRLFAWRGAFGIIGKELDGAYVSGEFPTFQADASHLDIYFLRLWFQLPGTLAVVNEDCSGSTPLTRNRFKEKFFLALQCPLPPLSEQRQIVAQIEELAGQIQEARTFRQEAAIEAGALVRSKRQELIHEAYRFGEMRFDNAVRQLRGSSGLSLKEYQPAGRFPVIDQGMRFIAGFCDDTARVLRISKPVVIWGDHTKKVKLVTFDFVPGADGTKVFQPNEGISAEFLFHFLKSVRFPELGYSRHYRFLKSVRIPTPPPREQSRIVGELDALQAAVDNLNRLQTETTIEMESLLPSVLNRAFRVEL